MDPVSDGNGGVILRSQLLAAIAMISLLCLGCGSSTSKSDKDITTQDTTLPDSTSGDTATGPDTAPQPDTSTGGDILDSAGGEDALVADTGADDAATTDGSSGDGTADVVPLNCKAGLNVPSPENQGIVISEVRPQEYIELYNPTDITQVVTDLFLCFTTDCTKLLYLTNDPSFEILPGRYRVANWPGNNADGDEVQGEVSLSINADPAGNNYANLIDYICWDALGAISNAFYVGDVSDNTNKWDKNKGCAPSLTGSDLVITRKDNIVGNEPAHYITDGLMTAVSKQCSELPPPPKVVDLPGGGALSIDFDTLPSDTTVEVTAVASPTTSDFAVMGPFFEFGPSGVTFNKPMTISIPYDPAKIPNGFTVDDLAVFTSNVGNTGFDQLAVIAHDKVNKTLTANLFHFSTVGVGAKKIVCCLDTATQQYVSKFSTEGCPGPALSFVNLGQCPTDVCCALPGGITKHGLSGDWCVFEKGTPLIKTECDQVCCDAESFKFLLRYECRKVAGVEIADASACDSCSKIADPIEKFCCYQLKACSIETADSCRKSYTENNDSKLECVKKVVFGNKQDCTCL